MEQNIVFSSFQQLVGHDERGGVYKGDSFVVRKINSNYERALSAIYDIYKKNDLHNLGIVDAEKIYIEGALCLKHPKYLISYPYEWSLNAFRDALLFHLNLFIELDKYDIVLKDALPSNVLFNFTDPIFIDFLSLVKKSELSKEGWLLSLSKGSGDLRKVILEKMFIPYSIIPYLLMVKKEYSLARDFLLNKACNMGEHEPVFADLFNNQGCYSKIKNVIKVAKQFFIAKHALKRDFISLCQQLHSLVSSHDVTPLESPYLSYYDEKKENYFFEASDTWQDKQKNVYKILREQPSTVLDLGANSGWFSFLAAYCGAQVTAVDIDESCVDYIYRYSKKNKLKIQALKIAFEDLEKEYFAHVATKNVSEPSDLKKNPLFIKPIDRLQADTVFCLALLHHLVLGAGYEIKEVMQVLAALTLKKLVVEFVDWSDNVIIHESSFFPAISSKSTQLYSLDLVVKEGLKYFFRYEILSSYPASRQLIVFYRN